MKRFLLPALFFPVLALASVDYRVEIEGVQNSATRKSIRASSRLVSLEKRPVSSINALRYRAHSDIPEIRKVLRAAGYYEPKIAVKIDGTSRKLGGALVTIEIEPGPLYTFGEYTLEISAHFPDLTAEKLGVIKGESALSEKVVASEKELLSYLANSGYPLAKIVSSSYVVSGKTKRLNITEKVELGPLCTFGPTTLTGLHSVEEQLVKQHLAWREGEIYSAEKVDQTQKVLLKTGVFTSVFIENKPDEKLGEKEALPIAIEMTESKHKTINIGASYQTFFGPGVTFGWENRNLGGMARKLSVQGEITRVSHTGVATLLLPDIHTIGQDYTIQFKAVYEDLTAYLVHSYSLENRFDKKIGKKFQFSIGVVLQELDLLNSVKNGRYQLAEVPVYLRWSSADSLLNPTKGNSFEYRITPSFTLAPLSAPYLLQGFSWSNYLSLLRSDTLVFAQKITASSLLAEDLSDVAVSKRLFGGSEEEMRGYSYRTVSPLTSANKPIGGASALYYTAELRFRPFKKVGFVPFFDIGTVQNRALPSFSGPWLRSAGLGLRYFSFIGPFRCDIAFPLDRRAIDPKYRILVSLGQTF